MQTGKVSTKFLCLVVPDGTQAEKKTLDPKGLKHVERIATTRL